MKISPLTSLTTIAATLACVQSFQTLSTSRVSSVAPFRSTVSPEVDTSSTTPVTGELLKRDRYVATNREFLIPGYYLPFVADTVTGGISATSRDESVWDAGVLTTKTSLIISSLLLFCEQYLIHQQSRTSLAVTAVNLDHNIIRFHCA